MSAALKGKKRPARRDQDRGKVPRSAPPEEQAVIKLALNVPQADAIGKLVLNPSAAIDFYNKHVKPKLSAP